MISPHSGVLVAGNCRKQLLRRIPPICISVNNKLKVTASSMALLAAMPLSTVIANKSRICADNDLSDFSFPFGFHFKVLVFMLLEFAILTGVYLVEYLQQ